MTKLSKFKTFFTEKLKNKYRLIVRNDESLQERVSFVLTPLNVLLLFSGTVVIFFFVFLGLVAYTPVGHLIPTQGNFSNPQHVQSLEQRLDSLQLVIKRREQKDTALRNILRGLPTTYWQRETIFQFASQKVEIKKPAFVDRSRTNILFFPPLRNGFVTDTFNVINNHAAVDIVSYENASIKSTQDGTVVLSSWTPETGHVILIQHANNTISVYKHNSVLLKKQGDSVKAGEVIALLGNSGELTSGSHLHFELWMNGRAVNPLDFVSL